MEIVFYVRLRGMYALCLVVNEIDPSVHPERKIYLGLTYAWGVHRYASWRRPLCGGQRSNEPHLPIQQVPDHLL